MTLTSKDIRIYDPIRRARCVLEGGLEANSNYVSGEVFVEFDPAEITVKDMDHAIRSVGYRSTVTTEVA